MIDFNQTVEFCPFDGTPLATRLNLREPPFARRSNCFKQLNYIRGYVAGLKCSTIVIERRYIDRDYMEDHSVFYSRNFFPYTNSCQRIHFFSADEARLRKELNALARLAGENGDAGERAYRHACEVFSERFYLGFCVIKPLHGCPVGRSVLRCYPKQGNGYLRLFPCTRNYDVHLFGIRLNVRGLAFQQQDAGVSACATTALWSALHKIRSFEEIATATPAQITMLASRYTLPFGRTMPAEGLSLDQMCQAVQSLGLSPNVYRTDKYEYGRSIIYSAAVSGMAPILILKSFDEKYNHAVTLAGIKVAPSHSPSLLPGTTKADTRAGDLLAAYVHDDRNGPYVRASLTDAGGKPLIKIGLGRKDEPDDEPWHLSHILIAMHSKIRMSFAGLQDVSAHVLKRLQGFVKSYLNQEVPVVLYETRIVRAFEYVERLLFSGSLNADNAEDFYKTIPLTRYLGVVSLSSDALGSFDVLVDSTGTIRNLLCLGIVCKGKPTRHGRLAIEFLAREYECVPDKGTCRLIFLPK